MHQTLDFLRLIGACDTGYKRILQVIGSKYPKSAKIPLWVGAMTTADGLNDIRWCIEHGFMIDPEDFKRFKEKSKYLIEQNFIAKFANNFQYYIHNNSNVSEACEDYTKLKVRRFKSSSDSKERNKLKLEFISAYIEAGLKVLSMDNPTLEIFEPLCKLYNTYLRFVPNLSMVYGINLRMIYKSFDVVLREMLDSNDNPSTESEVSYIQEVLKFLESTERFERSSYLDKSTIIERLSPELLKVCLDAKTFPKYIYNEISQEENLIAARHNFINLFPEEEVFKYKLKFRERNTTFSSLFSKAEIPKTLDTTAGTDFIAAKRVTVNRRATTQLVISVSGLAANMLMAYIEEHKSVFSPEYYSQDTIFKDPLTDEQKVEIDNLYLSLLKEVVTVKSVTTKMEKRKGNLRPIVHQDFIEREDEEDTSRSIGLEYNDGDFTINDADYGIGENAEQLERAAAAIIER